MLHRRLFYAAALLGALAFQIFNSTYLAHFLLALALTLPGLSLLVSLPAMLDCRIVIRGTDVARETDTRWQMQVTVPHGLPLARLTARIVVCNRLTGEQSRYRVALTGLHHSHVLNLPADTRHCGRLECVAERVRVCDCLGLFALRRPVLSAALLVLPKAAQAEPLPPDACANQAAPEPGARKARTGEDYELRPYRPGDPMRLVHWKLSAKQDDLVVREMLSDAAPTLALSFDRFGAPATLDHTFDRLGALCRDALLQRKKLQVFWRESDGTAQQYVIASQTQLRACLAAAMSQPAPRSGTSPDEPPRAAGLAGPILYYHIAAREEDAVCQGPSASGATSAPDFAP